MKIVVDDKIPYIREALEQLADVVVYKKGSDIGPADVSDADALIVRTRTRCDERLLGGSRVRFVATATIGYDHLATDYLERAGIEWMNCPGCNASSVAQYVRSVLILLKRERGLRPEESTLGVVGCGHVGSLVRAVAEEMGFRVVVSDPPLGMEADLRQCDVITYHVPLTREGAYATWHMCDEKFLQSLTRVPYIINSSRGEVVDGDALLSALEAGQVRDAVVDTWEHEPDIDRRLLQRVFIGTPHIAGYSADGKVNADNMVIDGLCKFLGIENNFTILPPPLPADFRLSGTEEDRFLQLYNPLHDSRKLKSAPEKFEELRGNYPLRREKMG